MDDILKNPKNIKNLAHEVIKVCDGYWSRQIPTDEAEEVILYWSKHQSKKLFKGADFNPTIKKIIGKQRIELLNEFLKSSQMEL